MTTTTINLKSDAVSPAAIPGLTVRVFTTSGVFVTSGVTNSSGQLILDLPDADYDLMFFKSGVSLINGMPQRITVSASDPDSPPNTFQVNGHVYTLPESVDPILCRISGSMRGADGRFSKDIRLAIGMSPEIAVLSGFIISPQDIVDERPDENGYYEFDLLRGMKYNVYFPQLNSLFGQEPPMVLGIAPDQAAVSLTDFLLPVPVNAVFGGPTLSLVAGTPPNDSITCSITYSDGSVNHDGIRPVPPYFTSVKAVSSNDLVASAIFQVDRVCITPVAPGTVTITIVRTISPNYLIYDPVPVFTTQTLTVTVT